jgi:hypothetical protein
MIDVEVRQRGIQYGGNTCPKQAVGAIGAAGLEGSEEMFYGPIGEGWCKCEAFLSHCGNFVCLGCVIVDREPNKVANTREGTGSKQFPEHLFSGQVWKVEEKE